MESGSITLSKVADLDVSAASGLVVRGDELFVIADDELFAAVFDREGRLLRTIELCAGRLPEEHAERKRRKPDFEALAALPDGRILALGSGSTSARMRSVCFDPAQRRPNLTTDWSPLYEALARSLPELNIEGAVVQAGRLWLAQRGNGAAGKNACIELDLDRISAALAGAMVAPAEAIIAIHPVALGSIEGAPLSLTDLAAHPDGGLIFSAAAEPSGSTYDDAPALGSALGTMTLRGEVTRELRVLPVCKLEGIALTSDARALLSVADPDDRSVRAPLFHAPWPFH